MIGVGEYLKEDYQEIYNISDDKENLDKTWEEWKANKSRTLKEFKKMGIQTIDIIVTPREIVNYCRKNGFNINGESRSRFIQSKLMNSIEY